GGCPVVISLSGTSISARDSADAYKVGEKEGYRFGVRGAWLLAPTRHGAHNWEGPGLATAMAARRALPRLQLASRVPVGAGSLVAGHSMGGHGAWLLACALDDVLGVVSSASWLRKDQYADSNKVLLHDVASPHVEPALAALLKQAEAPFDAEALAPSLADLPVLIRVGSRDRTVHPWFSRRMYRTLLAAGASPSNVTLTEIEGKEHWWWDSEVSNDGGAVNDVQIRRFFEERLSSSPPPPTRWRLRTFNVAYSGAKHGLRILQMGRVDRLSEVSVEMLPGGAASLRTTNVRSLRWGRAEAVELDGQQMVHGEATWCLSEGTWHSCAAPKPAGPMGRVFSRKLCGLADEEGQVALQYVANLLLMTGHGSLVLLRLEDVRVEGHLRAPEACENLLLVGTPQSNPAIAAVLKGADDGPSGPGARSHAAMAGRERAHKFMVVMSLTTVFLFSGTVFGWGAFSSMLQQEGYFDFLCEKPDPNHPCEAQLQALNNAFTMASTFVSLTAFVNGWLVDTLGPTKVTMIAGFMSTLGLLGIALTRELPWTRAEASGGGFDTFLWSTVLVAVGGSMTMFIGYQAPFLVPSHFTLLIEVNSCLFDAGTIIFPILKVGPE
ncbi:unnamed protein product, partial [Effrenium voratum]